MGSLAYDEDEAKPALITGFIGQLDVQWPADYDDEKGQELSDQITDAFDKVEDAFGNLLAEIDPALKVVRRD